MTEPPIRPGDIAEMADELKVILLSQQITTFALMHPGFPLGDLVIQALAPGDQDLPISIESDTGHEISFSTREVMRAAENLKSSRVRVDLMSTAMLMAGIRLGDAIKKSDFKDANIPLLEFARHYRNACAHGGDWTFNKSEPRHPAKLRDLELDKGINGQRAVWGTVDPYLHLMFLDDIQAHFLTLAARRAIARTEGVARGLSELQIRTTLEQSLENEATPGFPLDYVAAWARLIHWGEPLSPTVGPTQYRRATE